MKHELSDKEKRLYRQVEEVLHYMWDPIGVAGIAQARDEYHGYLPQVFKLVLSNKAPEEIANYLSSVETESMGLSPSSNEKVIEIAKVLLSIKKAIIDDGF